MVGFLSIIPRSLNLPPASQSQYLLASGRDNQLPSGISTSSDLVFMMRMPCTIALLALAGLASAATVEVYWDITWVNASPDGYSRPVIGINGVWPCPKLEATVGDTVIVHVDNKLGNETTSLHWHGITQRGTPEMDGPVAGTQCSVPPGSSVTYKFLVCSTAKIPQSECDRPGLTSVDPGR